MNTLQRKCAVCARNDSVFRFRPAQSPGPVVRCRNCGFIYVNPIYTTKALIQEGPVLGDRPAHLLESSNSDDIIGSWEQPIIENYLSELSAKRANAQESLRLINVLNEKKGSLLDIGCFCGLFLSMASQAGWDCYGIEPLVMPAIYARAHFGLDVITDTLREDTFPPKTFDVVTSFQVFEHLINPDREIEKIRQMLKPNGLLVIEVPNIETIAVKILGKRHRHFVQDHVSFFSSNTLCLLLERMGFQVLSVYFPTRVMSFRHLIWWIGNYGKRLQDILQHALPKNVNEKHIRFGVRDIVTVIARKM